MGLKHLTLFGVVSIADLSFFLSRFVLLVLALELVGRLFAHRACTKMGAHPAQRLLWMCVLIISGIAEVCGKL